MKRISKSAIKYRRVTRSIYLIIPILTLLGLFVAPFFTPENVDFYLYLSIGGVGLLTLIYIGYYIIAEPILTYKYLRYQIGNGELIVEQGIFTRKRHVAPLFRIQNIDVSEGPIMRKFGLSGITFSTASEKLYIPELEKEEAIALRQMVREIIRKSKRGSSV